MLLWFNVTEKKLWCALIVLIKKGNWRIQEVTLLKRLGW